MTARSGRAVVGLDFISQAMPRAMNSPYHGYFEELNPAVPQNSTLNEIPHQEFGPTVFSSPMVYHTHREQESPQPLCELCEEMDEWTLPIDRRAISPKIDWCSDCGKNDVGPPCKCSDPLCSKGRPNTFPSLQWHESNHCFPNIYENHFDSKLNQQYISPFDNSRTITRTTSDCNSTSLQRLAGLSNGISTPSSKHSSHNDLTRESPATHKQRELDVRGHMWGVVCLVLVLAGVAGVGVSVALALKNDSSHFDKRVEAAKILLRESPLVDGHNDLPWNIRKFMHNKLHSFNMTADLSHLRPWSRSSWSHTDLPRLKKGHVGAQFWVSYVPCESQYLNAVQLTIEQIDLIKRLIDQYPNDLQLATTAEDVETSFQSGRIASLIGVEGGHAIQNSLGVLRALYDLGVRYMTLTHTCSTPWAECARNKETDIEDPNSPRGLTHFGKTVVREMNRLGILVDLSHVSQATMRDALQVSKSPVLFSHSSVYAICKNPRNVPDDILRQVAVNGGLVMISFYNHFLTCNTEATIKDVVNHINHVKNIAGIDHVGIGADFDGVDKLPHGLEDVSKYPNLFAELMSDPSWSVEDLKSLAGLNLLRVLRQVEKVRREMKLRRTKPLEMEVPPSQLKGKSNCSYNFVEANPS